jgi:hypothetical protein
MPEEFQERLSRRCTHASSAPYGVLCNTTPALLSPAATFSKTFVQRDLIISVLFFFLYGYIVDLYSILLCFLYSSWSLLSEIISIFIDHPRVQLSSAFRDSTCVSTHCCTSNPCLSCDSGMV